MLWLLAAALPGAPLEAGAHVMRAEADSSFDTRLHDLFHGRHEQQESGVAATALKSNNIERHMPRKQPTKSGLHDLFHGKHKQAPSRGTKEGTRGKHGKQLSMGMHELFHGFHKEPPGAVKTQQRKRNPLKQPARDHAQRRDAPLDRLSKGLHSMLHGPHDAPANLKPEKQDVLGKLSVGMHGMLHGGHQKPGLKRSVSLRAAAFPDRPRRRSKTVMGVQLSAEEEPAEDLTWGNEQSVGSNEPAAVSNDNSFAAGPTEATDFGLRSQPEAAEDAAVRQESSELGEAERHEREAAESARAQTQREAEADAEARRQQAMDANQKEKMELAEAKQQAKEEDERLRTEEEDQIRQEANGAITLVVLSDRVLPIQVSLGSVLMKTSYPLNIWVIGDDVAGLEETLKRTLPLKSEQHVRVMTMDAAEKDIAHLEPPWMSNQAGRSVNNDSWISKHTVRLMDWDHDAMHHSRFNIMRFYIPYLSAFADVEHLLFMDDDVIMTGDIRLLADAVVPEEAVLVGQCDNFAWQDQCSRYVPFVHGKDWTTNSATLYLQQNLTNTNQHQHCPWADRALCGPSVEEHTALLLQLYAEQNDGAVLDFKEQPVWNFGLVRDSPWPVCAPCSAPSKAPCKARVVHYAVHYYSGATRSQRVAQEELDGVVHVVARQERRAPHLPGGFARVRLRLALPELCRPCPMLERLH